MEIRGDEFCLRALDRSYFVTLSKRDKLEKRDRIHRGQAKIHHTYFEKERRCYQIVIETLDSMTLGI